MKQRTAVEKLEILLLGVVSFDSEELRKKYKEAFQQAKLTEKEQHKQTFNVGFNDGYNDNTNPSYLSFEKYYNEMYGK